MRLKLVGLFALVAVLTVATTTATALAKEKPRPEAELRGGTAAADGRAVAGARCRKHPLVFKGEVASASATGITVAVTRSNRHARALVGQSVAIAIAPSTKLRPKAVAVADLSGKRVHVHVRRCTSSDALVAAKVVVHSDEESAETEGESSSDQQAP